MTFPLLNKMKELFTSGNKLSFQDSLDKHPAIPYNTKVVASQDKGESYNGSITVSKTVHGGSNPSSPAHSKGSEIN